jgi:D-glycero-alpha-D-manno-heptose-7-phosphate kinase
MIITRTPLRISFFGGGTDYPVWYEKHGGAVLSTTIDKYCYITCRNFPPFFDARTRIVWSKIELANDVEEIEHPAVKGVMKFFGINNGLEIHHVADLPARSGLGASSSFTVGLINALNALEGKTSDKGQLIMDAIHVERNIIGENVGSQDQAAASFGGFNKITFNKDHSMKIAPLGLRPEVKKGLEDNLLLFFTGLSRSASDIAAAQIKNTPNKEKELKTMQVMVDTAAAFLEQGDVDSFGKLLHESWLLKRSLSDVISTPHVDAIYDAAREAGALGGKLLGAGGGGFMLIYADPSAHAKIKERLKSLLNVPFKFEGVGSEVIYNHE